MTCRSSPDPYTSKGSWKETTKEFASAWLAVGIRTRLGQASSQPGEESSPAPTAQAGVPVSGRAGNSWRCSPRPPTAPHQKIFSASPSQQDHPRISLQVLLLWPPRGNGPPALTAAAMRHPAAVTSQRGCHGYGDTSQGRAGGGSTPTAQTHSTSPLSIAPVRSGPCVVFSNGLPCTSLPSPGPIWFRSPGTPGDAVIWGMLRPCSLPDFLQKKRVLCTLSPCVSSPQAPPWPFAPLSQPGYKRPIDLQPIAVPAASPSMVFAVGAAGVASVRRAPLDQLRRHPVSCNFI